MERSEKNEPHAVLSWFVQNAEALEGQIKRALDAYSDSRAEGRWAKSIVGIGPVIAAGLLAHLGNLNPWHCNQWRIGEGKKKPCTELKPHKGCGKIVIHYAGQVWNFAGIGDPSVRWEKNQLRPWNARLKTLTWKIGQSFLKLSNNPECLYGRILRDNLDKLRKQNVQGQFQLAAKEKLERFAIAKNTDAYLWYSGQFSSQVAQAYLSKGIPFSDGLTRNMPTMKEIYDMATAAASNFAVSDVTTQRYLAKMKEAGYDTLPQGLTGTPMLPPAHILQRACRYAVKIFLSHYHCVAYELHFKEKAALPYIIAIGGHRDYIAPPNWPLS